MRQAIAWLSLLAALIGLSTGLEHLFGEYIQNGLLLDPSSHHHHDHSQCRISPPPQTPRHIEQDRKLAGRMKKTRDMNVHHPRTRLLDALHGYARYYQRQREELDRLQSLYKKVTRSQHRILEKHVRYSDKFITTDSLLRQNQALCSSMVDSALSFYGVSRPELEDHIRRRESEGRKPDRVAVSQTLKHIVRDWTVDGAAYERDDCFDCIARTLDKLFPENPDSIRVLLPGSGLGRLGHDISQKGFQVTLNEWSMFMNVAYRFLETHASSPSDISIHPFIDSWSHHASTADMQRPVRFPDVALNASGVVLVEGDFTTVLSGPDAAGAYDVVVTYFFIDTARNLASYFDTIRHLLRKGGHWINLGPLLYGTAPFVQLSLDEIVTVVTEGYGFRLLDLAGPECGLVTVPGVNVRGMQAAYGFDDRALTRNAYHAQFWVAQKT
ncbi:carnosine N-methyltransferase [Geosmithia morbida]|uniref:Carnosine N-methyltransferase n=1 Tax=Geosmithia morbida TaxID=1094350 RepID=A0A9P5D0V6_9HYPO|nr:carnosine N-methyltransferase [Geosmithia morbida]KAF4122057.1 carnosine N-methyltransferase [Geosmithia morbida]